MTDKSDLVDGSPPSALDWFGAAEEWKERALTAERQRDEARADAAKLRETVEVGKKFLASCNSAWACGEPTHRVQAMLKQAANFQTSLAALADEGASR